MSRNNKKPETGWYKDAAFVKELDAQYKAWKSGKSKGYSQNDVDKVITKLKNKRRLRF